MQEFKNLIGNILAGYKSADAPLREKLVSSAMAFSAILLLLVFVQYATYSLPFKLLVLASMGASAFLLFVTPHSPMAQPWPVFGGHMVSALAGVACAQWVGNAALAAALAVLFSILAMYFLHSLHPPSVATAMIAVLGGPEVHAIAWKFCYEVVAINAGLIVLTAFVLNNIVTGRRYPARHSHHAHHAQFSREEHKEFPVLQEDDFKWALGQMDGFIDVSAEDLVDLYEFAVERAEKGRQQGQSAAD